MSSFSSRSIRWLARVIATRPPAGKDVMPGIDVALDGETAVAVAEGLWCDVACLGASFPASVAARAWARRAGGINALGGRVRAIRAHSGPGALAAAIGASSAGARATAFVSGQDLSSCGELLHQAAGRRLPLVLHVATRATAGHAVTFGAGHDAWHAAADAGWIQLFATNVQEAVDLALVGRLAAERALVPVMIGVDGPETAMAAQDVLLPEPAVVRELLRGPAVRVPPPTPAQRIIFGEYRETIPRWHDLDEPGLLGGVEDAGQAPPGIAAGALYFASHARECLEDAIDRVGKRTGRHTGAIETHATRDADVVIVAMGSTFESARVATERLRSVEKLKIGVVGVRQYRPLPASEILEATHKASTVIVFERAESALASHGALTREVICALAARSPLPHVCSISHGIGGVSATPHAIAEACLQAVRTPFEAARLGVTVSATESTSPKREAVLDAVRRDYPHIERTAIRVGPSDARDVPDSMRIAVRRAAGAEDESFAGQAAALLHALGGGRLRSLPSMAAPVHGIEAIDVLEFGEGVSTPMPEHADIGVLVSGERNPAGDPLRMVGPGSTLLVALDEDGHITRGVRPDVVERARTRQVHLVGVPVPPPKAYERPVPAWRRHEALLGALASICADRLKGRSLAKAAAARERLLEDVAEDQRSERLAAFRQGYEGHAAIAEDAVAPPPARATWTAPLPATPFTGRPVKSPAEHWTRVGSLGAEGRTGEFAADPFAACGVTPAGSSERRVIDEGGTELLEFDPESCDGSSACWVGCPDGSVVALALGARAILDAGVQLAAGAGVSADALSPIANPLARAVHKSALDAARPPTTVLEACEAPYRRLIEKMPADDDRRSAIDAAFKAVMEAVGILPIARTALLFDSLEHTKAGSGAFLIVGINPDASRDARASAGDGLGCGLRLVERTPAQYERASALWRIHTALPDTSGEVIAHASAQAPIGPMGGVLLSRSCSMALATGDDAEPGSGDRLAARLVVAACEAEVQPRLQRFLEEVRELRERLGARIHETLAGALPDSDLDALAEGLRALGREDVELAELGQRVSSASESGRLDTASLTRLVDAGRALADLEWRLTTGPTAHGRARFGGAVALGPGTMWAGAAPFSPFRAPLVVAVGGSAPELSRGLLEGQATTAIESIRVVRWAKAELDQPGGAEREQPRLRALSWDDLNEQEQGICPPMLLLGDDESLTRGALGSLLWLLSTNLPVKVVLLSGAGGRADTGSGVDSFGSFPAGAGIDVGLLAMLARKAYVVQTSVGAPDHLAEGVRGALRFAGPALIHVHAPSPGRHGFPVTQTLDHARLAVASRAFPLVRFDPSAAGVFGTCLDLNANPSPDETLATNRDDKALTPLDWLITEARFRERFRPLDDKEAATNADTALGAPPSERTELPIKVLDPLDRSAWVASAEAIEFADDRMRLWRTFQELAGLVTPFTRRVREDAEQSVAADRQREIDDLKSRHEAALAELRAGFEAESVARVREGLLALAGYPPPKDGQG